MIQDHHDEAMKGGGIGRGGADLNVFQIIEGIFHASPCFSLKLLKLRKDPRFRMDDLAAVVPDFR